MSSFQMYGVVTGDFDNRYNVEYFPSIGNWINGEWVENSTNGQRLVANVQPVGGREISYLNNGGERISDARTLYITQPIKDLNLDGVFKFLGESWKIFRFDARPENTYYKIIIARVDE